MVNWLAKATEALRRAPPLEPEPYEVACAVRTRMSGDATAPFRSSAATGAATMCLSCRGTSTPAQTEKESDAQRGLGNSRANPAAPPLHPERLPARRHAEMSWLGRLESRRKPAARSESRASRPRPFRRRTGSASEDSHRTRLN